MLRAVASVLTRPAAGPVATAVAAGLALSFALASSNWSEERAELRGRIAQLSRETDRSQAKLSAQLTACRTGEGPHPLTEVAYDPEAADATAARRLLDHAPAGIDACARMEAADQAVLSNLK